MEKEPKPIALAHKVRTVLIPEGNAISSFWKQHATFCAVQFDRTRIPKVYTVEKICIKCSLKSKREFDQRRVIDLPQ